MFARTANISDQYCQIKVLKTRENIALVIMTRPAFVPIVYLLTFEKSILFMFRVLVNFLPFTSSFAGALNSVIKPDI